MLRPSFISASVLLLMACGSSTMPALNAPPEAQGVRLQEYTIDNEIIGESSGLARSQRQTGLLWTLNDSGGSAALYALDDQGRYQGVLDVSQAINVDWEDLASYTEAGAPRLLVADVGDNFAVAPAVTLHVLEEPPVSGLGRPFFLAAPLLRSITVRYPDGARDCEAVAVDAADGFIYLLSKRDAIPRLYRVPLVPSSNPVTAEFLTTIQIPRAPTGHSNPNGFNWVTAMDFSPDNLSLVVNTLEVGYVYPRLAGESWSAAVQRAPLSFDLPNYSQIEAGTVTWDGMAYFITSENLPARMARISLP